MRTYQGEPKEMTRDLRLGGDGADEMQLLQWVYKSRVCVSGWLDGPMTT